MGPQGTRLSQILSRLLVAHAVPSHAAATPPTASRSWCILGLWILLLPAAAALDWETHILEDESSPTTVQTGGYDVLDVWLSEAYDPTVGEDQLGDGLYVHALLARPVQVTPQVHEIVFQFQSGTQLHRRTIVVEGADVHGDFDRLRWNFTDTHLEIERAFVALVDAGLHRGDVVTSWVVQTYAAGQLRDQAPGGTYLPGLGAAPITEGRSRVVVANHTLRGPTHFFVIDGRADNDTWVLTVRNPLRDAQRVFFEPKGAFEFLSPPVLELAPGGDGTFRFKANVTAGAAEGDILGEHGGRVELEVKPSQIGRILEVDDTPLAHMAHPPEQATPGTPLAGLLLLLGLAACRTRAARQAF